MAGAAGASSGTARYSSAYKAGARGAKMPSGLSDLADSDPKIDHAYDAGANGVPFEDFAKEHGIGDAPPAKPTTGGGGPAGRPSPRRSGKRPQTSFTGGAKRLPAPSLQDPLAPISAGPVPIAHAGAGLILGAVFYALVLSVVDYGPSGPKMWFKAKFLNQVTTAGKAA